MHASVIVPHSRAALTAHGDLQPTIPRDLDLSTRDPIDNLSNRIDLRRLYPTLRSNPPKVYCPWHDDQGNPSLGVFRNNVYCFTCHRSAGALDAIRLLCRPSSTAHLYAIARALLSTPREEPVKADLAPLDRTLLEQYHRGMARHTERRDWLVEKYGLKIPAQEALEIGHAGKAFTFPVYNLAGELVNIRFRRDPDLWPDPPPVNGTKPEKLPRYWGLAGRNQALWYLPPTIRGKTLAEAYYQAYGKRSLVWTEGELDAAALWSLGVPALSTTNGCEAFTHESLHLEDLVGCKVYVMFDADAAGLTAGEEAVNRLLGLGIEAQHIRLPGTPGKDAAELVARGWTRQQFRALLQGSQA